MSSLLRRSPWFCVVLLSCLSSTARAGSASPGEKVPQPIPSTGDVKTPAPIATTGPSRIPARAPRTDPVARAVDAKPLSTPSHGVRDRRFERVQVSEDGEGAIWVRGRDYKARFGADGVTFVPFFGSKAETNHPVRFSLVGARVGESELEIDTTAAPVVAADRVEIERGALRERWNLALGSVEQQFVIDSLAQSGDLVLRIGVATDLSPDIDDGRLSFGCELGRVEYGAATAIDAVGRHFALASTWAGDGIELRLDRVALASAQFPLVIDPVVSTTTFDSSLADDHAPDTAYEVATNSFLVVYEETYSATDHDVYALHLDANGTPLFGGYLDYTTDDWRHPKVASNALAQNFLCVAAVTPVGGGLRRIRGATFAAATNTPGAQFTISGAEGGEKLNPDVGGDPLLIGPTYYFVVWQRAFSATDHDVHARLVHSNGTTPSPLVLVDNSSGTLDTLPAISKSDGGAPYSTQNWTIVWQRHDSFSGEERIWGAQYRWDGSVNHATFPIDQGDDCFAPSVSSLHDGAGYFERPYMVSFQVRGQQQVDWDVLGAVFEGPQFIVGTDVGNYVDLATLSNDQIRPRVDCDGHRFSVTYAQEYAGGFADWDIFVADLVYAAGYPWVASWSTFAYTSLQELSPAITSTYSGGGSRLRYLAAWDVLDQLTPGAVRDVWTGLWDGGEGGYVSSFCSGDATSGCPCSNFGSTGNGCANSVNASGAHLGHVGNPWIGNDSFTLVGTGMPNATALYFQGTGLASGWFGVPFGDGLRCVGGTTIRLGTKPNVGGSSQVPEPGDPTISSHVIMPSTGAYFYYQAWYRNAAAYCTASTFNLTNGLRAVWAP